MRLPLIAAACLLLLTACTTTLAAPRPAVVELAVSLEPVEVPADSPVRLAESILHETYVVKGDSAAAVRTALNREGPYSPEDGRVYDAVTRWGMRWSFRWDTSGGVCSLGAATIEVAAVTVLPELTGRERLTPQVLARWDAYLDALTTHELDHVQAVQNGVRALRAAFHEAPAMETCSELAAYLTGLGQAYEEAMRLADANYDALTGHGRTQGAVFP